MNGADIQALIVAVQTVAGVLSGLGVPGLFALAACGPAFVLITVLVLDHMRARRIEEMFETNRITTRTILESYRTDTQAALHDGELRHAEAVRFYHNNVDLVKGYQALADSLQYVVINNTKATERLTTIIESRGTA